MGPERFQKESVITVGVDRVGDVCWGVYAALTERADAGRPDRHSEKREKDDGERRMGRYALAGGRTGWYIMYSNARVVVVESNGTCLWRICQFLCLSFVGRVWDFWRVVS